MSDIRWTPSCGGNFFEGTACRTCTTCLNNLERIKAATGLVSGSEEDKELLRISRKNVDDWAREFQKERAKSLALKEALERILDPKSDTLGAYASRVKRIARDALKAFDEDGEK